MEFFVRRPDIERYPGVIVYKDTELEYKTEKVTQSLKDLVLITETKTEGEGFEAEYRTKVFLSEGDILYFEEGGRGYIKPVESFVTVQEAIQDLEAIADL